MGDKEVQQLRERVASLEEENRELQQMLQKIIKKYKKLKEKMPQETDDSQAAKKKDRKKSGKSRNSETKTTGPESQSNSDLANTVLQSLDNDNLSYIQSVLSTVSVNYYFESTGNYLIHEAVKSGAIKILHFLCAKGADMNAVSDDGESPLTLGAEKNMHDSMCIILQHGRGKINIEFQNNYGLTALQIAVKNGNKEITSLLIAHGANANATNVLGDSLIKIAQKYGHQDIVLLLVNAGASLR